MLKTITLIFGIVLLALGLMGFIPTFTQNDLLFGTFHVNGVHNLIHVGTGVVAILCGLNSDCASRTYFKVFGLIYAVVAGFGFYSMNQPIFNLIANNTADNILHVVIAVVALYLGFGCCCQKESCDIK